ncbi:MAG: hypothetical protein F6K50_38540 [Moorea sp. SIO3I7]|nr:hypothetical protein [Moorena sp. SIO3I7]
MYSNDLHRFFLPTPYSLLPTPYSLLPTPWFRFPIPDSRFPIPDSLLPKTHIFLLQSINLYIFFPQHS